MLILIGLDLGKGVIMLSQVFGLLFSESSDLLVSLGSLLLRFSCISLGVSDLGSGGVLLFLDKLFRLSGLLGSFNISILNSLDDFFVSLLLLVLLNGGFDLVFALLLAILDLLDALGNIFGVDAGTSLDFDFIATLFH